MAKDRDRTDDLVQRILREILGSDRFKESSAFSQRSYSDEPILRTGADLRREQDARRRERARERRDARGSRNASAGRDRHATRDARTAIPSAADITTYLALVEQDEDRLMDEAPARHYASGGRDWGRTAKPRKPAEALPPTLKELRALERQTDADGAKLRGAELFVRQARVAANYTDDHPLPFGPQYRYYPSYQQLSNEELRGYFTWRAAWRTGGASRMPFTYVRLVAAELVNGVGAEPGNGCLAELQRLDHDCQELGSDDLGPDVHADLRTWIRDYVVYFGLDPKLAVTDDERAFAQAVATLRLAERDVLARKGLRDLTPADAPAKPPSDEEVWQAFGSVSKYAVDRSPFFRKHPEESAAVGAAIFRRMAEHCAKRRKVLFVDGIVGEEQTWFYTPFLGVPFLEEREHADVSMRITACETISYRFGRWRIKRGFERRARDKKLGQLLKAIDRQMRLDWGFGRALKGQKLPKYVERMVVEESAAEHARVEEAERRRIKIDLSQLGHIRAAAATTREALLVDEEREESVTGPGPAAVEPTAASSTVPAGHAAGRPSYGAAEAPAEEAGEVPVPADGAAGGSAGATAGSQGVVLVAGAPNAATDSNPCGLTDLELAALRRLLDSKGIEDLLGQGTPMASVLVDSINEKLFDEVGDAVVEFDDNDTPHLVEDYEEDVRSLLGT